MSTYQVLGDRLVSSEEMADRHEDIRDLHLAAAAGKSKSVRLSIGQVDAKAITAAAPAKRKAMGLVGKPNADQAAGAVAHTPVGPNKPLLIMLNEVYLGDLPKGGLGSPSMVTVTSMKDLLVTGAAPRALNIIKRSIKAGARYFGPSAPEEGTQVIAYSPAVTSASLTVTIEIAIDRFPGEAFTALSETIKGAGALPLLLPAQGYIAAAGVVTKMIGDVGELLWDNKPKFSEDWPIRFNIAGFAPAEADFRIITQKSFNPDGWRYVPDQGLVDPATKTFYAGPNAYVVASLDGAQRDDLKAFTPLALSASLASKYFAMRDGAAASMAMLGDAAQLLNDAHFRQLADAKQKALAAAGLTTEQQGKLREELNGLIANIQTDVLKPQAQA